MRSTLRERVTSSGYWSGCKQYSDGRVVVTSESLPDTAISTEGPVAVLADWVSQTETGSILYLSGGGDQPRSHPLRRSYQGEIDHEDKHFCTPRIDAVAMARHRGAGPGCGVGSGRRPGNAGRNRHHGPARRGKPARHAGFGYGIHGRGSRGSHDPQHGRSGPRHAQPAVHQ